MTDPTIAAGVPAAQFQTASAAVLLSVATDVEYESARYAAVSFGDQPEVGAEDSDAPRTATDMQSGHRSNMAVAAEVRANVRPHPLGAASSSTVGLRCSNAQPATDTTFPMTSSTGFTASYCHLASAPRHSRPAVSYPSEPPWDLRRVLTLETRIVHERSEGAANVASIRPGKRCAGPATTSAGTGSGVCWGGSWRPV
jgi:hypothetical protein